MEKAVNVNASPVKSKPVKKNNIKRYIKRNKKFLVLHSNLFPNKKQTKHS